MNHQLIIATIIMSILSASNAFNFNVNWVQNPKESLNAWSSRMRFQINDNLVFKNDNQAASILVVKKEDFDSCSVSNPIDKVQGSNFQLKRPGPYYFISSDAQKCMNGQKVMVVVLSPRGKKPAVATPVISPIPSLSSPTLSPSSSSLAPSLTSPSLSPSSSIAPSTAPSSSVAPSTTTSSSGAPSSTPPTPSTSEITPGPTGSEGPAGAPKPTSTGSALGAASVTIVIAIVGNVILA